MLRSLVLRTPSSSCPVLGWHSAGFRRFTRYQLLSLRRVWCNVDIGGYARFSDHQTASDHFVNISEQKIEQIIQKVRKDFRGDVSQMISDNNQIIVDLLRQDIKASENRVVHRMDAVRDEIIAGFADTLDSAVLPQVDSLDRRVTRIEKRLRI